MQDRSLTHIHIRTVLFLIKKHRWKSLSFVVLTLITVAVGTLLATPIYQASSQLLVKPGREDAYVSPVGDSPPILDRSAGEGGKVNAEIAILRSHSLIINLVDRIGLPRLFDYPNPPLKERLFKLIDRKVKPFYESEERDMPPIEKVHKSVMKSFEISRVPRSNVIKVTFEWPDPVIAAWAVNTLVELYLDEHLKVHTNPQTYNLLEEQAKTWQQKLRGSEKKLEDFKRSHTITSLPEQRTLLLGRISEAESQQAKTQSEIHETLELVASLKDQLSTLNQTVQLEEKVDKTPVTLADLKARLVELELQGLKEEIAQVKEMIAKEEKKEHKVVVSGRSPIREALETDLLKAYAKLETLKAREKNQEVQMATYEEQLKTLGGHEKRSNELEREIKINEAGYKLYLTRFEESKISASMDEQKIASVRVIEPALPILKPVKPKKKLNILIGGLLGIFFGIGMTFLIEFIHPVFRTREDVEDYLGLPVLATVGREKQYKLVT